MCSLYVWFFIDCPFFNIFFLGPLWSILTNMRFWNLDSTSMLLSSLRKHSFIPCLMLESSSVILYVSYFFIYCLYLSFFIFVSFFWQYLDVIIYYFRKWGRFSRSCTVDFTTTDTLFDESLQKAYTQFIENNFTFFSF